MSISGYYLKASSNSTSKNFYSFIDTETVQITRYRSILKNLKQSILNAIAKDEEVICCILEDFCCEIDFDLFEELINDLVLQEIYSFYLAASAVENITFNEHFSVLVNITKVSAFILTNPLYKYVLSLLEDENLKEIDVFAFFKLILPHSILIHGTQPPAVIKDLKIHIISPFRNARNYLYECWTSIFNQVHTNYHVYFIDDNSDDDGIDLLPNCTNVTKIINEERLYALRNTLSVLSRHNIAEEDIVCILDGDDVFPHKYVLSILNTVYQQSHILFTYGSMTYFNSYGKIVGTPYSNIEFNNIRKSPWKVAPLRSFRFKTFRSLLKADSNLESLKDSAHQILRMPADMALSFSLLEMIPFESAKFIPSPMYQYRLHDNNDMHINRVEQYIGELLLRDKPPLKINPH